MASKTKAKRRASGARKPANRLYLVVLAVLVVVASLYYISQQDKQEVQPTPSLELQGKLMLDKFNAEWRAIVADNRIPETLMSEIRNLAALSVERKVEFVIQTTTIPERRNAVAWAITNEPKAKIAIHGPVFMRLAASKDPDLFRSTFINLLFHERVHLDRWPAKEVLVHGSREYIDEEVRTYTRMIVEAIRPMHEKGWPIWPDYLELSNTLKNCGDKPECPKFREFVTAYTMGTWQQRKRSP